jgi:polysaccharide biosynthesis protein PslG
LKALVALLALALAVGSASPGAAQVATGGPEYGATVFPLGFPETTPRDIQLLTEARLGWARIAVPWRSVEGGCKACFDWNDLDRVVAALNGAGLQIMVRLSHPPDWARATRITENGPPDAILDYTDFAAAVADRYREGSPHGTIQAIGVWNEPNLTSEWNGVPINRDQAAQYLYMLKQTYGRIKGVDPSKIVVSAGLSPTGTADGTAQPDDVYLTWLYEEGLARYSDVVGLHGAGFGSAPEAEINSNPAFQGGWWYFRRIEQLRAIMVANGDEAKQVWLLEFGWTIDPINSDRTFYAVTPEQQADYLIRGFTYAREQWSPWIGVMFIWNLAPDPNWTPASEQYWWSITEPDGTPRPAYSALVNARANGALP